jgi:hypothetical protein
MRPTLLWPYRRSRLIGGATSERSTRLRNVPEPHVGSLKQEAPMSEERKNLAWNLAVFNAGLFFGVFLCKVGWFN